METNEVLAKGLADRIGIEGSNIKHVDKTGTKHLFEEVLGDHKAAFDRIMAILTDVKIGSLKNLSEIEAIGHRVVHGGEAYSASVLINEMVLDTLKSFIPLAPLHNPANIMGIEACMTVLPGVPNVAVFDTAFHQTMKPEAFLYAIPKKYYRLHGVRRYGFHGTSHKYVANKAAEFLWKPLENLKLITCHVGNGASITAIDNGKVVDTSMGFTPLEGLVMGTRSGDLDPAILTFLARTENLSLDALDKMLNKESGVLGISEVSGDMREIEDGHIAGNEGEALALDIYVRRIVKYIGSYFAVLGGCDAVILTAGVLENSAYIREMIATRLACLGVKFNPEVNNFRGKFQEISTADSRVKLIVIPTDEEYMIAKEAHIIVGKEWNHENSGIDGIAG